MMIHSTPEILPELLEIVKGSDCQLDKPIRDEYKRFESSFIYLHPFLKIKKTSINQIKFENRLCPNKIEICKHTEPISWAEMLKISSLNDIKQIDRSLAFMHRAYKWTNRHDYFKLYSVSNYHNSEIRPAQVDDFPAILENKLFNSIKKLGYDSVFIYSLTDDKSKLSFLDNLISDPYPLPPYVRIETPDSKILIVEEFDQRFGCLHSSVDIINILINDVDFEGFFCDENTIYLWSWMEIEEKDRIYWDEDMQLFNHNNAGDVT